MSKETPHGEHGKMRNWHLTETGTGASSVGVTDSEPGFYEANAETGEAASSVAPGDFVEKYVRENNDGKLSDDAVREAIRAWQRQEGYPLP